ncbi:hypothetical protein vseg_005237 [Gypsophila vaccaria]
MAAERAELTKLCSSRNWSKAILLLDSFIDHFSSPQDLCNRAFCYSQLQLHKHVIEDCDRALERDPTILQAYILKGHAVSALGRKDDAMLVWKQGYDHALNQSADLKEFVELHELVTKENTNRKINHEQQSVNIIGSSAPLSIHRSSDESGSVISGGHNTLSADSDTKIESDRKSDVESKLFRDSEAQYGSVDSVKETQSSLQNSSEESDGSGAIKKSQKTCVSRDSTTESISFDIRMARGIAEVNGGRYTQAISIFDQMLKEDAKNPEALIGRGTAYVYQLELDAAISDFTKAIEANPLAGEALKRRGQARAASGDYAGGIDDLTKALKFEPNSADILRERGILNFNLQDFDAAIRDLSTSIEYNMENKSAYTFLGLSLSSIGEYKKSEESLMKTIQLDGDFSEGWTYLAQLYLNLANTTKAFECLTQALKVDDRDGKVYYMRGLLSHGIGDHRNAIKDLSVALSIDSSSMEYLYLRASCHHAVGEFKKAVEDYDATFDLELDSMDKFVLQYLAFYQKEIALYTASKIGSEFSYFDIDGDIDPLFKEYWCKRLHPKDICEKVYGQPSLQRFLKKSKNRKHFAMTKQRTSLLHGADSIGQKIQYHSPGFLPNKRQHRMAGLAVIEIAQKVSRYWRSLHAELKNPPKGTSKLARRGLTKESILMPSRNRGGPCSTSGSARATMSWQEVYSLAVKWRQISEPCDPVVWINKLSEEFTAGFGSHTPIILGQLIVTRYFPNFQRTFGAAKTVLKEKKYARSKTDAVIDLSDDSKLQDIMLAESCSDLHNTVGEDFYVSTWCNSLASKGEQLEGTRISLLKMGVSGFEFAIGTPSTPFRWNGFDSEMEKTWEALCTAYCCDEAYGSTDFDALENIRNAILRMTYYWYNFMPLSRGTGVVGFVVLLGLCLAANMEFSGEIPEGLQVDWEAMLTFDPDSFVESIKKWLYPDLKVTKTWKAYPDVESTLSTTGSVIAALSTYDTQVF